MGEYQLRDKYDALANELTNLKSTLKRTQIDQNRLAECFQIVDTIIIKILQIQQLHMDLIWNMRMFTDTGRKLSFLEAQKKKCEQLEEDIQSLKQNVLERIAGYVLYANTSMLPKTSEESMSAHSDISTQHSCSVIDYTQSAKEVNNRLPASMQSFRTHIEDKWPQFDLSISNAVRREECGFSEGTNRLRAGEGAQWLPEYSSNSPFVCKPLEYRYAICESSKSSSHYCTLCGKTFVRKDSLRRHTRVHSGIRPYECKICAKTFSLSVTLGKHMRTHSGEKPFECKICEKRFNRRFSLNRHLRMHTGEKPYSCKTCEKNFGASSHLTTHMLVHRNATARP